MDIQLPVYLYDVVTTALPPRLIVTCRTEAAASAVAAALRDAPRDGTDTFTVAPRRVSAVTMAVEPGSSVIVRGYEVASEVLAEAIKAATPEPEPALVEPPPAEEPAP